MLLWPSTSVLQTDQKPWAVAVAVTVSVGIAIINPHYCSLTGGYRSTSLFKFWELFSSSKPVFEMDYRTELNTSLS